MRWSVETKIRWGFGLALVMLAVTGALALWSTSDLVRALRAFRAATGEGDEAGGLRTA